MPITEVNDCLEDIRRKLVEMNTVGSKGYGKRRKFSPEKATLMLTYTELAGALKGKLDIKRIRKAVADYGKLKKDFHEKLFRHMKAYDAKAITMGQLTVRLKKEIATHWDEAYLLGTRAIGSPFGVAPEDSAFLKRARATEYKFLEKFMSDIKTGREKMDRYGRLDMYANSLDGIYQHGQVDGAPDNVEIDWVLHPAEHSLAKGSLIQTEKGVTRIGKNHLSTDYVLTEFGPKNYLRFVKQTSKECFEVETERGYALKASELHRILVYRDHMVGWVFVKDLKDTDYVVLKADGLFPRSCGISVDEAALYGIVDGDGYIHPKRIGIVVDPSDFDMIAEVLRLGKVLYNKDLKLRYGVRHHEICFYGQKIVAGLSHLRNGSVPDEVLKGTRDVVARYLKLLFSADGAVDENGFVALTNKDKGFIREVQFLLLRFGIISTIGDFKGGKNLGEPKKCYRLHIVGSESNEKFIDCIGFIQKYKNERLRRDWQQDKLTVPIEMKLDLSFSRREAERQGLVNGGNLYSKEQSIGYCVIKKLISRGFVRGNELIINLLKHDCIFEKVARVKSVGIMETYDIERSETGTVVANGIVVHNCPDCLKFAAEGPYTKKTLPAVPRDGTTQCLSSCKCTLRFRKVEPKEPPRPVIVGPKKYKIPPGYRLAKPEEMEIISGYDNEVRRYRELIKITKDPKLKKEYIRLRRDANKDLIDYLEKKKIYWTPGIELNLRFAGMKESIKEDAMFVLLEGGPGSGHWGHAGRKGVRGGSKPGGRGAAMSVGYQQAKFTGDLKKFRNAKNVSDRKDVGMEIRLVMGPKSVDRPRGANTSVAAVKGSRQGKCYETAGKFVMGNTGWTYVESVIHPNLGPYMDKAYHHAYAEKGNVVYDGVLNGFFSKESYRIAYLPKKEMKYSSTQLARELLKSKKWGVMKNAKGTVGNA